MHDLEAFIEAAGDTTVIRYLAQKYCVDNDTKQRALVVRGEVKCNTTGKYRELLGLPERKQ